MADESGVAAFGDAMKTNGSLRDYLAIARLDHSTKQVFIVPGFILACLLRPGQGGPSLIHIIDGLLAAFCIASANYVINEWLDRDFDRHHPTKVARVSVQRALDGRLVALEWLVLVTAGLSSAACGGIAMLLVAGVFALEGLVYNVPPLRTKDLPYFDVISESINNPLRLMIGWLMVDATTLPPSSVLLAYWFGGAFLMAAKRFSEYREITAAHGKDMLVRYRASFAGYSEVSLNVSCFVYGMLSVFFLAVFLIKYRVEYLLLLPVVVALFGVYLALALRPGSSAQRPERLFRERGLILLVLLLAVVFCATSVVDIPALTMLTGQRYISLK